MRALIMLSAFAALTTLGCASTGLEAGAAAAPPPDATSPPPPEAPPPPAATSVEKVTLPSPGSPLVAIRLVFRAGSIHDPEGKEGLAALTGLMLGRAGTAKRSYSELIDRLYPMAASIDVDTDREVTVIRGEVHRDHLDEYAALLGEAILEPGFSEADLERNRQQLRSYLTNTLRASNDELLGLETLQQEIFRGHPYGHAPAGTVAGLDAITLDDVREFYRHHVTRASLLLGVAGGYPEGFVDRFAAGFAGLPAGEAGLPRLPPPPPIEGRLFTIVEKATDSVGIHFGHPLPFTRADPEYYPLMVANSFLGEHRTFHGRLMKQLRGKRGLNYGDYSYIEYWDRPPFTTNPTPNVPRRQQVFSVWIRPVVPSTAHFALRNALYEVDRLIERGLTPEEFELTRDYLINYSKLWAQTLSRRLGFLMDSRFYGMDPYIESIDERLRAMTVEDVNRAAREHLQTRDLRVVLVANGAERLETRLWADLPSPMEYNSPPEPEVIEADRTIERLIVNPRRCEIVPVDQMFERR